MVNYNTQDAPEYELTPEGSHESVITEVDIYNNAGGQDKLIVKFTYGDEKVHSEFITPSIMEGDGFRVFADLLSIVAPDSLPEGDFDEQTLLGTECVFTIKHNAGKGKHEGKTFANMVMIEAKKKA